jgi:hypothetical protein
LPATWLTHGGQIAQAFVARQGVEPGSHLHAGLTLDDNSVGPFKYLIAINETKVNKSLGHVRSERPSVVTGTGRNDATRASAAESLNSAIAGAAYGLALGVSGFT